MNQKSRLILFFTLFAALLLTSFAGAAEDAGDDIPVRAIIVYEESAGPEQMEELLSGMDGVTLLCRYEAFFTGAAVETDAETLVSLSRLDGVSGVGLAEYYECASSSGEDEDVFTSEECLAMMNADKPWEEGYTGDGTVIAVLDSGCNVNHEVFADASLVKSPALSEADIEAFAAKGGSKGAYISPRIPFAYDYYSLDDDVSTTNNHGTHVTALAAGYARSGGSTFRGAAPGAQILAMKIFPNGSSSGTDDTIILRALEDAWNLGADVVNLSIGTGAGFSGSDTINGIYCRAYKQMAESGVIICCAAGNSEVNVAARGWGPPLPTGRYTDYSSVLSPGSFYGVLGIAAAGQYEYAGRAGGDYLATGGYLAVADYSSWGPASGLHLDPALTGFGGAVISASAKENDQYHKNMGTSIASPYVAGSMAVMLQSLREKGVTDRLQASALAQQLLESHARLLIDPLRVDGGSGLPASPRQQGAGLIDLEAALSSTLVVANPLIELGDNEEGRFTLPVTLQNLSNQPMSVTLDVLVLTDEYGGQNGVFYSLMMPKDITSGVTVSGGGDLTVPAGGTATTELELSVTAGLKEELAQVYPNGFYVEGYITATGGGQTAHGAFLGYCGDWNAAPVLERTDFRDLQTAIYQLEDVEAIATVRQTLPGSLSPYLRAANAELGVNIPFLAPVKTTSWEGYAALGFNGHANVLPNDARNAIPSRDSTALVTAGDVLCLAVYTQRDAARAVMLVSDQETGEVYYVEEVSLLKKSEKISSQAIGKAHTFAWAGTDADETPLPAGTRVRVDVCAWLETDEAMQAAYRGNMHGKRPASYAWMLEPEYDEYRELSFPVTLDGAPPTTEVSLDGNTLNLSIRDGQYTAYAAVQDAGGSTLAEKAYALEAPGETCTLSADFSDGALPEKVYIVLEDYATNTACYELDLQKLSEGEAAPLIPCTAAILMDVTPADWYHEAVDYIVENGIMEVVDGTIFRPYRDATRWEIVSALYQANGRPETSLTLEELPLHDVSDRSKYITEVCWAYEKGVVSGHDDGAFYGTANVNRQELALMLYRCARLSGKDGASGDLTDFPDSGSVADWAKDAMCWAVGAGIIHGDGAGKLAPEEGVTRAEMAQILMRFLEM